MPSSIKSISSMPGRRKRFAVGITNRKFISMIWFLASWSPSLASFHKRAVSSRSISFVILPKCLKYSFTLSKDSFSIYNMISNFAFSLQPVLI